MVGLEVSTFSLKRRRNLYVCAFYTIGRRGERSHRPKYLSYRVQQRDRLKGRSESNSLGVRVHVLSLERSFDGCFRSFYLKRKKKLCVCPPFEFESERASIVDEKAWHQYYVEVDCEKDRAEKYTSRCGTFQTELGRLARSIVEPTYKGAATVGLLFVSIDRIRLGDIAVRYLDEVKQSRLSWIEVFDVHFCMRELTRHLQSVCVCSGIYEVILVVKMAQPDGSGNPDVQTSRCDYKRERGRLMELLVSVGGQGAASPYHMVTKNTSHVPPTGSNICRSSIAGSVSTSQVEFSPGPLVRNVLSYGPNRESTSTSLVEFMPKLLLPTDLTALKYGRKRQSTSTPLRDSASTPHVELMPELLLPTDLTTCGPKRASISKGQHRDIVPPIHSLYRKVGSSLSAAGSKADSHLDARKATTSTVQEDQFAGSAASSSRSVPVPVHFEGAGKLEKGLLERRHVTDHDHSDSVDMDLDYDTYDHLMFDDEEEDPEELFDYRLDYVPGTSQPPREDMETEEAPPWYRNKVSSTGHIPPSTIWPDLQPQTSARTSGRDCKEDRTEVQGKATKQQLAASVVGQTGKLSGKTQLADGRGQSELLLDRLKENSAGERGDESALLEGMNSSPRPKLDVDFQRALAVAQDSETFREAFKALYKFTEASSKRGCFISPKALETIGVKEAKGSERMGPVAMLIPKEEPVQLESTPSQAQKIQVKQDERSDWNYLSSSSKDGDPGSCQKTWDALRRLEQVWVKLIKDHGNVNDLKEPAGETFRPDLMHLTIASSLRGDGFWLNEKKRPIGHCPGVPVGACFNYRVEMAVIGLHRTIQSGIGIIPADFSSYRRPIATSVVLLTGNLFYKDDKDMGVKVVYSGQGGLRTRGTKKKCQDQKLTRGNLALANSFELGVPVRMIRGHTNQNTRTGRLYSYDGLYKVTVMNYKVGVHGNKVYLYTMVRLPGQGPLPVPSTAALIYKGEDDIDTYFRQRHKRRSRIFRNPTLQIKPTTSGSGSEHRKCKSTSARPGIEFALLVQETEPANGARICMSIPFSRSTSPRQHGARDPVKRVPVDMPSGSLREPRHRRGKASCITRFIPKVDQVNLQR